MDRVPTERLAGRTAIVFGGGHGGEGPDGVVGIGFACASTFAAHGASVVVVDRDAGAARRGADAIAAAGGRSLAVVADMLDEAQVPARWSGRWRRSAGSTSCRTTSATSGSAGRRS